MNDSSYRMEGKISYHGPFTQGRQSVGGTSDPRSQAPTSCVTGPRHGKGPTGPREVGHFCDSLRCAWPRMQPDRFGKSVCTEKKEMQLRRGRWRRLCLSRYLSLSGGAVHGVTVYMCTDNGAGVVTRCNAKIMPRLFLVLNWLYKG
jgi:hypothetical protein